MPTLYHHRSDDGQLGMVDVGVASSDGLEATLGMSGALLAGLEEDLWGALELEGDPVSPEVGLHMPEVILGRLGVAPVSLLFALDWLDIVPC